ncbi:MAG: hypothetical protein AAF726_07245 [Planctomycetota bacterium]
MKHLPKSLFRTSLFLGAALVALFLAGCSQTTSVPVGRFPTTYVEIEPNDTPFLADFVTVLDSRSFLLVDGYVDAIGVDVVDHIEFESSEPVEIEFFLEAFGPGADVDVSIYDPIADVVLATYAVGGPSEFGTIFVNEPWRPFQFVIEAFDRDAAWTLELRAFPHPCGCSTMTLGAEESENPSPIEVQVTP